MGWLKHISGRVGNGRRADKPDDTALTPQKVPALIEQAARALQDGISAYSAKHYDQALRCFEAAVAARHDDATAHHWLGLVYFKYGNLEDAEDEFVLATHFQPMFAEAWYSLAKIARRRDDHRTAVQHLERAIAARPEYAEAHNMLGASALLLGDSQRAVECFERSLAIKPDDGHVHSNLGYVLFRECGAYERGAAHLQAALEINPDDPAAWCNQSMVLSHAGRLEEAIAICDRLLAKQPGMDEARLNRALVLLKLGRFAEAWPDYEARKRGRSNYVARPYTLPEWQGQSLAGKTLLIYAEQGLGDEIMFASCVADVMRQGARCVIECAPRLASLFQRSFPEAFVQGAAQDVADTSWLQKVGRIDYQIAAGSLPGVFRRTLADFPQHRGYLRTDPAQVARWRTRLNELGPGRKIGIAWRGGMASTRRELRSTHLEQWLPVLRAAGCTFVSLQHGDHQAEVAKMAHDHAITVHHWQEAIDDYDQTAALVSALDLVISVQTATVHLAGALGRPVWVLMPAVPEWRYLQSGDRMPWYPSARLFRQQQSGNWTPVMATLAAELGQPLRVT